MRILLDTNVVLDVLLKREPFYKAGKEVLKLAKYAEIEECLSASAVTDIYYVAHRTIKDSSAVANLMRQLFEVTAILKVSAEEIQNALSLGWDDFEDAVQYSAALSASADAIVTRDQLGYRLAQIPVYTPDALLAHFQNRMA